MLYQWWRTLSIQIAVAVELAAALARAHTGEQKGNERETAEGHCLFTEDIHKINISNKHD